MNNRQFHEGKQKNDKEIIANEICFLALQPDRIARMVRSDRIVCLRFARQWRLTVIWQGRWCYPYCKIFSFYIGAKQAPTEWLPTHTAK
jgi:hypothetical protein